MGEIADGTKLGPTRARALGITLLSVAALAATAPLASADRDFSTRFATSGHGGLATAGNTLLTCAPSAQCTTALSGGGTMTNGDFAMRRVDVDNVASTFNSSTATVAMPEGAEVAWAGLYWGAHTGAGTSGSAAPNASLRNRVRLAPPDTPVEAVVADGLDTDASDTRRYQGFADITDVVRDAGEGEYTVANVQSATGLDRYAGWAIVVAYRLSGGSVADGRRIVVADGYQPLMRGQRLTANVALGGFVTPASGTTVAGRLVMLGWEGDRTITPDSATLDGDPLTDAANPADDLFNSTITRSGSAVTIGRSPSFVNTLGVDLDDLNVDGLLSNSATSTTVRLTTGYERFLPGVIALSIADSPPRNTVAPTISGTPATGETLTASTGTWTGSGGPDYDHTYQWQRCDAAGANCTDITGATSPSHTLTADDAGSTVRVVVVASNDIGPGDPAASQPSPAVTSTAVVAGNPTPVTPDAPTASGTTIPSATAPAGATTEPADLSTLPGSAIAAPRCTMLVGGGGFQRANLPVSGPTRLRARADGAIVSSSPAVITVIADRPAGLRSVRYTLDGRTVRGRRSGDHRLLLGPSQLTPGRHALQARLRLRGGTTRTLRRTLRAGACRSRFTALQYRTTAGTGVRLRVDTATPASSVTFRVPAAVARRLSRGTPAGRIRVVSPSLRRQYRFSPATGRRPSQLVPRNGSPRVSVSGRTIRVTGLPASTGIVELTVYQPRAPRGSALLARGRRVTARATVRSTRTLHLRATVRGTGGSTR